MDREDGWSWIGFFLAILMQSAVLLSYMGHLFVVSSVMIVDNNGVPSVEIVFNSEYKCPLIFYLLTSDGERISSVVASEGDKVVYLGLGQYYENIVGKRVYKVEAYCNDEVWHTTLSVMGVSPEVEMLRAGISDGYLSLNIMVRNNGDVPLYISSFPENVVVYVDGERVSISVNNTVIMPSEERIIVINTTHFISGADLGKEHVIQVSIAGFIFVVRLPFI